MENNLALSQSPHRLPLERKQSEYMVSVFVRSDHKITKIRSYGDWLSQGGRGQNCGRRWKPSGTARCRPWWLDEASPARIELR